MLDLRKSYNIWERFECGGITSPLVVMGTELGLRQDDRGLPVIFDKGHALCENFIACHHTLQCKEIRGKDRFPRHCIPPVLRSPELFMDAHNGNHRESIPPARRAGYSRFYSHLVENNFHCAQIEDSPPRVIRLLAIMTVGGNAFDEKINKFNRSMNRGFKLSRWFAREFGSIQCQAITHCDFSDPAGVNSYIEGDCITRCKQIAEKVTVKVQAMISAEEASKTKNEGRLS